jgi:hypothetical protein
VLVAATAVKGVHAAERGAKFTHPNRVHEKLCTAHTSKSKRIMHPHAAAAVVQLSLLNLVMLDCSSPSEFK